MLKTVLKAGRKLLFWVHRWLGVGLSVLFGLWFASGFVMMYVGYPELTEEEYFGGLLPLPTGEIRITPAEALSAAGSPIPLRFLLSTVVGRPAYRMLDADNHWHTVFADNGELFTGLTEQTALIAAQGYAPGSTPHYEQLVDMDQWSITASLDTLRPLHKVQLDDRRGTQLYISDVTGLVARDTLDFERGLNWLGTTIHWIYPLGLRRHVSLWENIIIYLSLAGTVAALTGLVIGTMRLRLRNRYSRNRVTPYTGIQRLHHILGMITGVFVLTFIFSGMISMNPWGVFNSSASLQAQLDRYQGDKFSADNLAPLPADFSSRLPGDMQIKEIEWRRVGDTLFFVFAGSAHSHYSLAQAGSHDGTLEEVVRRAAPQFIPDAGIVAMDTLAAHDAYYYSHHDSYRPLPVLRVRFDDPEHTWFHVDLTTGAVLSRATRTSRVERWLFAGMHSLDFPFLINNRPLWDIVLLLLSLAGTGFCVTSVILGWRRLKLVTQPQ